MEYLKFREKISSKRPSNGITLKANERVTLTPVHYQSRKQTPTINVTKKNRIYIPKVV